MTVLELVKKSFLLCGIGSAIDPLEGEEANNGLDALNAMLDTMSNNRLMIFNMNAENFPIVANTASYTIGSSGVFNTTRPQRLESAQIRDSNNVDTPLTLLNDQEYREIAYKAQTQDYPQKIFYHPTYPLATIYLWPVPTNAATLFITSWKQFAQVTLATTLALPAGYQEMLEYNLAPRIADLYTKGVISASVVRLAKELKAGIEDTNIVTPKLKVDLGLMPNKQVWSIYRG
jgi:hypothetical protein